MRIKAIVLQAAVLAAALLATSAAQAASSPIGLWIDHTGRGAVEITDCNGRLCGRIAWLKDPKNAEACGEQVLGDVKPVGGGKWDHGWIYDPDAEAKYDVELTPVGADKLRVVGYAGSKWLSETMTWKRAPADLKKCSKSDDAAAPAAPAQEAKAKADTASEAPAKTAKAETAPEAPAVTTDAKDQEATVAPQPVKAKAKRVKKTAKKKSGPGSTDIVKQIVEAMNDDADSSKSAAPSKRTCKMDVPYLGMAVSFPCQ